MRCATCGRVPIHTPIGTQITVASAMSTTTRTSVAKPSTIVTPTSRSVMAAPANVTTSHNATAAKTKTRSVNKAAKTPPARVGNCLEAGQRHPVVVVDVGNQGQLDPVAEPLARLHVLLLRHRHPDE